MSESLQHESFRSLLVLLMTTTSEQDKKQSLRLIKKLCVFCGSSFGVRFEYREAAIQLGSHLANSGIALVHGGARVGLMGALADSVLGEWRSSNRRDAKIAG